LPDQSSIGSFSGNTRQFDAGGGVPEKQLNELQKIGQYLADIKDNTKEGLVFS
jgi:hypothetical protein